MFSDYTVRDLLNILRGKLLSLIKVVPPPPTKHCKNFTNKNGHILVDTRRVYKKSLGMCSQIFSGC